SAQDGEPNLVVQPLPDLFARPWVSESEIKNRRRFAHGGMVHRASLKLAFLPDRCLGWRIYEIVRPEEQGVARLRTRRAATVGVAEHANSAVLVTVAPGGKFLDRRRIDLTDRGLPTHPHHHEGSWAVGRYLNIPGARALSLVEAVALVERVRASAAHGAREGLEALAAAVPVPIASIAIRACPKLPPTTEERIADNRAQTLADSVMYRQVPATAAEARGWSVHGYDRERVFRDAAAAAALAVIGRRAPRPTAG